METLTHIAGFMNIAAPFMYGVAVAITAVLAYMSKCYTLCSMGSLLLVGWMTYVNAPDVPADVLFNMFLDFTLFLWLGHIGRNRIDSGGSTTYTIVARIFIAMWLLHCAEVTIGIDDYAYYLIYNMLFALQLIVVSAASTGRILRNRACEPDRGKSGWIIMLNASRG